jgi:AcrR family transcriptional regulator
MKNRILETAAHELNERGVKFTIDSVANRLGISKKTLYLYYSSKDKLISSIVAAVLADMSGQEQAILASDWDFRQKLIAILHVNPLRFGKINDFVLDDIKRCRPEDWAQVEQFRQNHSRIITTLLEDGAKSGEIRPLQAAVASQMLSGAVGQVMDYRFLSQNNITFHDALQVVADIFLRGVLSDTSNANNT